MQAAISRHQALAHVGQHPAQHRAEGIGEGDVGHGTLAEKAQGPLLGAIDELIWHQHIQRLMLGLQGAHGRHRQDPAHLQGTQGPDVRLVGHLRGGEAVVAAVTGQKHNF